MEARIKRQIKNVNNNRWNSGILVEYFVKCQFIVEPFLIRILRITIAHVHAHAQWDTYSCLLGSRPAPLRFQLKK